MDRHEQFAASMSDDGRYRLLVDAITDYAIYMLDADGLVTSWNPGAQRFKGYAPHEIIGEHFRGFTPRRTGPGARRSWRCRPRSPKDGSKAKAGASARTEAASGRMWSSIPSAPGLGRSWALRRSPGT
jgi:PAS domain-containing protein